MSFSQYKNYLANMGLYLKDALDKGNMIFDPSNKTGLTAPQADLRDILTQIWNNQDNLKKGDMKILEHLSKK
jgi:hypothetical protein